MKLASAAALLVLTACHATSTSAVKAASRPFDWRPSSLRLEQGMSEQQAIAAIGYSPDSASLGTCGQGEEKWQCRTLEYGDGGSIFARSNNTLTIIEEKNGDAWRVNSWFMFP